jgi:hypothetical protein
MKRTAPSVETRAVFDYFIGYKLGLTATPNDYLKKFEKAKTRDPREFERRILLDTYRTFGCEDGQPTFRYSLLDGVKEGFLVNPIVVDARSDITTQRATALSMTIDLSLSSRLRDSSLPTPAPRLKQKFAATYTRALMTDQCLDHDVGRNVRSTDAPVAWGNGASAPEAQFRLALRCGAKPVVFSAAGYTVLRGSSRVAWPSVSADFAAKAIGSNCSRDASCAALLTGGTGGCKKS